MISKLVYCEMYFPAISVYHRCFAANRCLPFCRPSPSPAAAGAYLLDGICCHSFFVSVPASLLTHASLVLDLQSYRTKAASARRDKAKGRTAGLTEEQKQEIRCGPLLRL